MKDLSSPRALFPAARIALLASLGLLLPARSIAVPFTIGELKGSFDSTISFGGL